MDGARERERIGVNGVEETILLLMEGLLLDHDSWPKFTR
jgi:hypothetical protein